MNVSCYLLSTFWLSLSHSSFLLFLFHPSLIPHFTPSTLSPPPLTPSCAHFLAFRLFHIHVLLLSPSCFPSLPLPYSSMSSIVFVTLHAVCVLSALFTHFPFVLWSLSRSSLLICSCSHAYSVFTHAPFSLPPPIFLSLCAISVIMIPSSSFSIFPLRIYPIRNCIFFTFCVLLVIKTWAIAQALAIWWPDINKKYYEFC